MSRRLLLDLLKTELDLAVLYGEHSPPTPPMWSGFDSQTLCHTLVEYVVASGPWSEWFFYTVQCRYSGFPLSTKTDTSKY